MNLLNKFLFFISPKRKILFLGRAGLIFRFNKQYYFIDSEMLSGGEYDICIYEEYIRNENKKLEILSIEHKKEIVRNLLIELNKMSIKLKS